MVESIGDALFEIIRSHPALASHGIEITSFESEDDSPEEVVQVATEPDVDSPVEGTIEVDNEELDEFAPGTYLCRWPNGDFSVVEANSKRDAIIELDEWAGANPSQLDLIEGFKADFGLSEDGGIVLHQFGEATREEIWERCYPALRDVLASDEVTGDSGHLKPGAAEIVRRAVGQERTRLWDNQPEDEPKTELGKRLSATDGDKRNRGRSLRRPDRPKAT